MVVPSSNGGPQVCEIGDWKISLRPRVKIAQSPHSALRASWGDWLVFTLGHLGDFPVSHFTDLRTSITTGYNHKISMNISLKSATDPQTGQSLGLAYEGDSKISQREFP